MYPGRLPTMKFTQIQKKTYLAMRSAAQVNIFRGSNKTHLCIEVLKLCTCTGMAVTANAHLRIHAHSPGHPQAPCVCN